MCNVIYTYETRYFNHKVAEKYDFVFLNEDDFSEIH